MRALCRLEEALSGASNGKPCWHLALRADQMAEPGLLGPGKTRAMMRSNYKGRGLRSVWVYDSDVGVPKAVSYPADFRTSTSEPEVACNATGTNGGYL